MRAPGLTLAIVFAVAVVVTTAAGATQILVTTLADPAIAQPADGFCTLREAITAADTNLASGAAAGECPAGAATDRITFAVAGVIVPDPAQGPLPSLGSDGHVTIDGWSAPGAGPGIAPRVGIDGALVGGAGGSAAGLTLSTADNAVRGLAFVHFAQGVAIDGDRNWIYGNHLGTNAAGNAARPNGVGVDVSGSENLVGTNGDGVRDGAEGNLISGNLSVGVLVHGVVACADNRLAGNRIGTQRAGNAPLPNQIDGVQVIACARTIVGTDSSGDPFDAVEGNLISGNGSAGVRLAGGSDTILAGNRIGLHQNGLGAIANAFGVVVDETVQGVRVGTDGDGVSDAAERNVISGNSSFGLYLSGRDLTVAGNYIGTNPTAAFAIPNAAIGVAIDNGSGAGGIAGPVILGGAGAVFGNVISGNGAHGVTVYASDVAIQCNFIGTAPGGANLGNGVNGIWRTIDGTVTVETNRIAFNGRGMLVEGSLVAVDNAIAGNGIGLEYTASAAISVIDNWWGDPSGPAAAGNPGGLGDSIVVAPGAGAVNYGPPWLLVDPTPCN